MAKTECVPQVKKRARLLYEIGFSIYFPLLLIMANDVTCVQHPAANSWIDNLQSLAARGSYKPSHPSCL